MQETQVQSLGQEDSPGGGNGHPLQCHCLGNLMGGGAWWGCSPRGRERVGNDLATKQQQPQKDSCTYYLLFLTRLPPPRPLENTSVHTLSPYVCLCLHFV